jgi:hypothetical protein
MRRRLIINDPDIAKTNANQCNRTPAIVIDQAAAAAGMKLTPENIAVDDGLKKESA